MISDFHTHLLWWPLFMQVRQKQASQWSTHSISQPGESHVAYPSSPNGINSACHSSHFNTVSGCRIRWLSFYHLWACFKFSPTLPVFTPLSIETSACFFPLILLNVLMLVAWHSNEDLSTHCLVSWHICVRRLHAAPCGIMLLRKGFFISVMMNGLLLRWALHSSAHTKSVLRK